MVDYYFGHWLLVFIWSLGFGHWNFNDYCVHDDLQILYPAFFFLILL